MTLYKTSPLYKYHSLRNDFILHEHLTNEPSKSAAIWCDRKASLGADGIIFFTRIHQPPQNTEKQSNPQKKAFFEISLYNCDGSPARFSGNGFACLARHLFLHENLENLIFLCQSRQYHLKARQDSITLFLPEFEEMEHPVAKKEAGFEFFLINVGNLHAIVFDNQDHSRVESFFARKDLFEDGINLDFVKMEEGQLYLHTIERGVGPTEACSSGAFASAICAHSKKQFSSPVKIVQAGGNVEVFKDPITNLWAMYLQPVAIGTFYEAK